MRYPKLRELREAVKSLFSRPYTTKFPYKPHEPYDGIRGKPAYNEETCVGCGACANVCPAGAITVVDPTDSAKKKDKKLIRRIELRYDTCIFCGTCEANCITETGVQLTKEYDLALFDRKLAIESVEKELIACELCGAIVTAKDHLKWLVKRLGTLSFGNPTLMLVSQRELIPVESGKPGKDLRRPDSMKVLCPVCRHAIVLQDIWGD